MKYIDPIEFYLRNDFKVLDVDGYYGGQCWDLFAKFCLEYCGRTFNCHPTGYVIDLWDNFNGCDLSAYFDRIYNVNDLQVGDWIIWKAPSMITRYSHIAMLKEKQDSNGGIIFTQNPNGNPNYCHLMWCSYQGFAGALRPKVNKPTPTLPNPVEANTEIDQFKVNTADTMRVRTGHNLNSSIIGFAKAGYYNIISVVNEADYTWYEVEKDKWIAECQPHSVFIPKYIEETPIIDTKPQESINISQEPQKTENVSKNDKKEHNNFIVTIIKYIIEIITKIMRRK